MTEDTNNTEPNSEGVREQADQSSVTTSDEMRQLLKEVLMEQGVADDIATVTSFMITRNIELVKVASDIAMNSSGGSQKIFSLWAAFCCGDVFIDYMLGQMVRSQVIAPAMAAALQQGCIYARNCYKGHVSTATAPAISEDALKMVSIIIPEWFGGGPSEGGSNGKG